MIVMMTHVRNIQSNENGMVLVVVVLMLAIITVLGVAATHTSTTEVQLATNERQIIDSFYKSEARLIDALEHSATWMTDSFLLSSSSPYINNDQNKAGNASVEIRWIQNSASPVTGLSTSANNLPVRAHTAPPPAGSGYSMGKFAAHLYGVTVSMNSPTSGSTTAPSSAFCLNFPNLCSQTSGNAEVQTGVWKVFNK